MNEWKWKKRLILLLEISTVQHDLTEICEIATNYLTAHYVVEGIV